MPSARSRLGDVTELVRRLAREALAIGQTRLELLSIELQEDRDRWWCAVFLALGCAGFGLLAGISLTAGLVVALWPYSPALALIAPSLLYLALAGFLGYRLNRLVRHRTALPATVEQLRQDRESFEQWLG